MPVVVQNTPFYRIKMSYILPFLPKNTGNWLLYLENDEKIPILAAIYNN